MDVDAISNAADEQQVNDGLSMHNRDEMKKVISSQKFVEPGHPLFWHGHVFRGGSNTILVPPFHQRSLGNLRANHGMITRRRHLSAG
jgi:hypothetical protein